MSYGQGQGGYGTYYGHEQPMNYMNGGEFAAPPQSWESQQQTQAYNSQPNASQRLPAWNDQASQSQQYSTQHNAAAAPQASVAQATAVPEIKSIERSAMFTFCPSAPFLAAGSVAGAIDLSFSTSSQLEIFSLDYASPARLLQPVGLPVQAPERFSKLSWVDTSGSELSHLKYGMLGGGLSDGTVCVWNPAPIIEGSRAPDSALLCRLNKHQGAVRGLEFNPLSPKLLASGAMDGEVCIWDLANPAQPSLCPAMQSSGASTGQVTCLQWNRKVQHILATGTSSGSVVVWDLKKSRPVITLSDSSGRRRCSSIAWNPEIATQVMVSSDDDLSTTLQLWDLRNAVSPVAELAGHHKGVLSLDWSIHDPSLLLSSGKDNRVLVWDVPSRQVRQEMSSGPNWKFQVQWSNKLQPGVFAGGTFEGVIGLHSLSSLPADASVATKPLEWEKKPVSGASFGFGGKLLKIVNSSRQLPTGETVTTGSGELDQLHADGGVSKLSPEFESAIKTADKEALKGLCQSRMAACQDPEEAETWKFLQTHFENDTQQVLLKRLGFESFIPSQGDEDAVASAQAHHEVEHSFGDMSLGNQGNQANSEMAHALTSGAPGGAHAHDDGAAFFDQHQPQSLPTSPDATSFFDTLGSPNPSLDRKRPGDSAAVTSAAPLVTHAAADGLASPRTPRVVDGTPGPSEEEIQRALFVGNYDRALETCIGAKRYSDALIIAAMMGGDAWEKTRARVMSDQPRPYMRIVNAVMDGDWRSYVASRSPQNWRETLATLLSCAPQEQFNELATDLIGLLQIAGLKHASLISSICVGNVETAVTIWNEAAGPNSSPRAREALLEKAVILGMGVDRSGTSSALGDLLAKQAEELASAGQLSGAYNLLSLVPGGTSEKANDLRDRLYQGGALEPSASDGFHQAQADPSQTQLSSQPWDAGFQQAPQQVSSYTQETYSAAPPQGAAVDGMNAYASVAPPQAPYQPPTAYGDSSTYAPSPHGAENYPASPYSTMSSSQAPNPNVFMPAQPTASAPPMAFQPSGSGQFGVTSPRSPQSASNQPPPQAPAQPEPQVFQSFAPAAPASQTMGVTPAGPPTGFGMPPQQQNHAPSQQEAPSQQGYVPVAPPQVFQPAHSAASGGFQQTGTPAIQNSFSSTFQPSGAGAQGAPAAPSAPPKPAGPPSDVALMTTDVSKISGEFMPIVNSFRSLYQAGEHVAATQPARKRELDDASKKLGGLVWKMNEGTVSDSVTSKLLSLAAALDAYDYAGAAHVQVQLTTGDWDECSTWLTALKRIIKLRQSSH